MIDFDNILVVSKSSAFLADIGKPHPAMQKIMSAMDQISPRNMGSAFTLKLPPNLAFLTDMPTFPSSAAPFQDFTMNSQTSILSERNPGEGTMKRDMDLVVKILDQTENRTDREPIDVKVDGYDELTIGKHVAMLFDAGYLDGIGYDIIDVPYRVYRVRDISWNGHEFLAVLRNEHGWSAIKNAVPASVLAKMPLKMIQEIATASLKKWVMNHLGLSE